MPIRPGRRGDEKQFQSGEVESFSRTLLATSISLLRTYFSLVFPVLAISIPRPLVRSSARSHDSSPGPDVPFNSTYCANNSNVATTAILERHGATRDGNALGPKRRKAERTNSGEDEPAGRARRGNWINAEITRQIMSKYYRKFLLEVSDEKGNVALCAKICAPDVL